MTARLSLTLVLVLALSVAARADRKDARSQVAFGIQVAQKGLWRDATMRFENATVADPTYASAWNNVAIGYEVASRFEEARRAYEKALELDPKNEFIKTNYASFREIYDRQNRRTVR
jgi:Tfp pilus assembly protein PilF